MASVEVRYDHVVQELQQRQTNKPNFYPHTKYRQTDNDEEKQTDRLYSSRNLGELNLYSIIVLLLTAQCKGAIQVPEFRFLDSGLWIAGLGQVHTTCIWSMPTT